MFSLKPSKNWRRSFSCFQENPKIAKLDAFQFRKNVVTEPKAKRLGYRTLIIKLLVLAD